MRASFLCFSHLKVECEAEDCVLVNQPSGGAGAAVVLVGRVAFIVLVPVVVLGTSLPRIHINCDVSRGLRAWLKMLIEMVNL